MTMGTESRRGTGPGEPVEPSGAPHEGDPTLERDLPTTEEETQAFQEYAPDTQPAAEPPAATQPTVASEPPVAAAGPPAADEPPAAGPLTTGEQSLATEPPHAAGPSVAATEPLVDRNRQTEEFAPLPVDAPWTAQAPAAAQAPAPAPTAAPGRGPGAPPPVGRPPRRGLSTGALVGIAAALVVLGAVAALALSSLGGDDQPTNAATPAAVATTVAAPSPTNAAAPTTQAPQAGGTVQVVRSGFSQLPPEPDGDVDVSYAVVLRNPRSDQVAYNVRAIVTFIGANGAIVDSKDEGLDALLPGQTAAVGDSTGVRGARRMRVQVVVGSFAPAQNLTGKLSASGVRTAVVAGELTTTATVHSTLTQPLTGADVTAVYYNGSGRIIGGQSDSVDVVPAGGAVPVRLDGSSIVRGIAKTEVYASPKDLVPGG
jgi:hypothetical protein